MASRRFADACNPDGFMAGFDGYLAYCDGACAYRPNPGWWPVRYIISSVASNCGVIGDCEPGNPAPEVWVGWVQFRRAAGIDPTIYCADDSQGSFFNGYHWSEVRQVFQLHGVPEPHWWIALPGATSIPAGAVAVQTGYPGPYDISLVQDVWPGVDVTFTPPVVGGEDKDMVTAEWNGQLHVLWVDTAGNLQHRWQGPGGNVPAPAWGAEIVASGIPPGQRPVIDPGFAKQAHVFVELAQGAGHYFQGPDGAWHAESI